MNNQKSMSISILCLAISITIFTIIAIVYPKVEMFDDTTPGIIFVSGVVFGIGLQFYISKTNGVMVRNDTT